MIKYWRLTLVIIVALFLISFRDSLPDIIKMFLIISIIGGIGWAGYKDSQTAEETSP